MRLEADGQWLTAPLSAFPHHPRLVAELHRAFAAEAIVACCLAVRSLGFQRVQECCATGGTGNGGHIKRKLRIARWVYAARNNTKAEI
jgi:hypothetical protein